MQSKQDLFQQEQDRTKKRLKFLVRFIGGGTPTKDESDYWGGNLPWVSPKDMKVDSIDSTEDYITELGLKESSSVLIKEKAVLVVFRSGILKRHLPIATNLIPVTINQDMKALIPSRGIDVDYLSWYLRGISPYILFSCKKVGATVDSIELEDFKNVEIILPSQDEQKRISEHFKRQTVEIDCLIADKEKLITLLNEQRQEIITTAVTRGLNPDVKMKHSGVEWISEMPENWEMKKFSHCVRIANGQVDPKQEPYSEMILIAPNHIESGSGVLLATETAFAQGAESGKYLCDEGDVIYSKIRPALQKVCVAPEKCICSADMYPMKVGGLLKSEFLLWLLLSDNFTQFALLESDRVAMPKINRESLSQIRLPIPPLREQEAIIQYINSKTEVIKTLISEIRTQIAKLEEYRQSLIFEAVTGRIDVRDMVVESTAV